MQVGTQSPLVLALCSTLFLLFSHVLSHSSCVKFERGPSSTTQRQKHGLARAPWWHDPARKMWQQPRNSGFLGTTPRIRCRPSSPYRFLYTAICPRNFREHFVQRSLSSSRPRNCRYLQSASIFILFMEGHLLQAGCHAPPHLAYGVSRLIPCSKGTNPLRLIPIVSFQPYLAPRSALLRFRKAAIAAFC